MRLKKNYSRIDVYNRPTVMLSMLNTQASYIASNQRMTIAKIADGSCFSIGKDFRNKIPGQDDRQFGIPRKLNIAQTVSQIALGKDHAVFLTTDSYLYSMGSNQYGQLGYA
jgi:alpha-tubulin suppressor-like RCC1 family protein